LPPVARDAPAVLTRSPTPAPTGFIEPCLPTLSRTVPDGSRWAFEVKHDGFRFVARRDVDLVRVFSRHGKDWTDRVPLIVEAMCALPITSATIHAEGVVCNALGVTDFERLRAAVARRARMRRSYSLSTCSRSTATIFAESLGKSPARR
jgi:bifunctional non-homologous end joining protein LigD